MGIQKILNLFNSGKGTAKSHMKNLIEMAAVDGNFDNVEFDLLKKIAKKNSISESQLDDIRKNPLGIKFELPNNKNERVLSDVIQLRLDRKSTRLNSSH